MASQSNSQVAAAIINFLFPSFGYLIQGRLFAFLWFWVLIAIFIAFGLATAGVGFIGIPVVWVLSIINAANYRSR